MKKYCIYAVLMLVSGICNAQFVLTPTAGLVAENGVYTISRNGTEKENYDVVKEAIAAVYEDAEIGEEEIEKTVLATIVYKKRFKQAGALVAADHKMEFTLRFETEDGKINVSFTKTGEWETRTKKGELIQIIHMDMGKNNPLKSTGNFHMFNSKGQIAKGGKKAKEQYEQIANEIVKSIENEIMKR